MICKVISSIEKYSLLDNVKTVAVGVSGGADSVCLLDILSKLKEKYGIILKAVHVNHNLRGDEALRDENFVRELCDRYGAELKVFSVDVKSEAERLGIGEEECGRILRYQCFDSMECDAVAVAHSLSDSIETMLFNLARGTALKGLCGISPTRKGIIRPLIECTRTEIEKYCLENGLSFVTDSTNLTCDYTRNHIRHNLIPTLSVINESYENNISRCMNSLSEDCDYLNAEAQRLIEKARVGNGYSISLLRESHPAVRKRVLAQLLRRYMQKDVDNKHVVLFDSVINGKCKKAEIGKNLYITEKDGIVYIGKAVKIAEAWQSNFVDFKAESPAGMYALLSVNAADGNTFDVSAVKGELYISSRKAGDSFTFNKRKVTKSLKKLFNEMKIPSAERNAVAVLHDGNNVVWVEGIGVNAPYLPKDGSKELLTVKKEG